MVEREQEWNHTWLREGVRYISKTQARVRFDLSKKEFVALLVKVSKENLQLRTKQLDNAYGDYFTVYSVEDIERILGLNKPK